MADGVGDDVERREDVKEDPELRPVGDQRRAGSRRSLEFGLGM